ncbi:hypothetical protein BH11PSE1_BH11PSE1_19770 [soil metagenome]
MAEMPNGKPRSVPDPLGAPYDEMIRQYGGRQDEKRSPPALSAMSFPPIDSRLKLLNRTARPNPYVTIGGRTYKGADNGRADVLVPVDDPSISPAVRADRRQAVNRALFMADHPLGSAAYAIATLADASPRARNGALMAGSAADAALLGTAPRLAGARAAPTPKQPSLAPPFIKQPEVRYGQPTALGQATRVMATLTAPMLAFGTKADRRQTPPGWQGNGDKFKEARGHLLAKQLGGSGRDPRNLVTLTQAPSNSPQMRDLENGVRRRVQAGEVVEYSAMPLYTPGALPPARILLTALGSRGVPVARIVENPAGRPR